MLSPAMDTEKSFLNYSKKNGNFLFLCVLFFLTDQKETLVKIKTK